VGSFFETLTIFTGCQDPSAGHPTATLHFGDQSTPVAGDHGVEVFERRVHVHGAHAVDVAVGCRKGFDALLEFTGEIRQLAARRDGIMKSSTRQWAC